MANYFSRWKNGGRLKCPHCNSTRLRKAGVVKERGNRQRYFCKACERHTIAPKGKLR